MIVLLAVLVATGAMVAYVNFDGPGSDVVKPEADHSGEAEGFAVTTAVAAGVAGAAIGAGAGYAINEYFDDGDTAVKEDVKKSIDNATNDTLRKAVHTNAIVSEGKNEAYLDNVDNDLTTIEGSLEQRVNAQIIEKADNITSKSELVTEAEKEASNYLKTTQDNLIETHNFGVLSLQQYKSQLDTANASDDMKILKQPNNYKKVSSWSELDSTTSRAVKLTSDIDIQDPIDGSNVRYVDMQGHTITASTTRVIEKSSGGNDLYITFKNGEIDSDTPFKTDIVDVGTDHDSVNVNMINVDLNPSYSQNSSKWQYRINAVTGNDLIRIYDSDDRNITYNNVNGAPDTFVRKTYPVNTERGITFNETEIANLNGNYANASEVPTVTLANSSGENVTVPGKDMTLSKDYYGQNNTVKVATPYDSNGQPITDRRVIIATPTSGISTYAEPIDIARSIDMIQDRDNLSDNAFRFVANYTEDVYDNSVEQVVNDPNKSIYDLPNVTQDLSQLNYGDALNPDSPEGVVSMYTGVYEGTTNPLEDTIHVEKVSNPDKSYKGALFSTNMTALMDDTSESEVVNEGDTFNASDAQRTIIVDGETGEVHELSGEYEITKVAGGSADVRTYDLESTDLSDQAQRLQDQNEVLERTVDDPSGFLDGIDFGGGSSTNILILAILAIAGIAIVSRRDDNDN